MKKGRTLEITLTEIITVDQGTVENEVVKKCNYLAHIDLINAFENLNQHLQSVCEMDGLSEDFKVSGFTFAGDGDEGVVITGAKKLSTGKYLNLVSPFIEFFGGDYTNADELFESIEVCTKEVKAYLDGKCAVKQMEMNFDAEDEDSQVNISDGSAPKKKGRKKKVNIIELQMDESRLQEAPEEFIEAV